MFIRKKQNKSGSVSVQVIDKSNGYRVLKTIGSTRDPQEIQRLVELGKSFIARQSNQYVSARRTAPLRKLTARWVGQENTYQAT